MIRVLFKKYLDDKSFKEGRRITMLEVSRVTGISRPTLTRIANNNGYNFNAKVIDALCRYFECTPGELLHYVPD